MSELTDRIEQYTGADTDAPESVALVILGVLRDLSATVNELTEGIVMLGKLDDMRAGRIKDLQYEVDELSRRVSACEL